MARDCMNSTPDPRLVREVVAVRVMRSAVTAADASADSHIVSSDDVEAERHLFYALSGAIDPFVTVV